MLENTIYMAYFNSNPIFNLIAGGSTKEFKRKTLTPAMPPTTRTYWPSDENTDDTGYNR